jgi:hypothetical protein
MGAANVTVRRSLSMRRKGKTMSGRFAFFRQNTTPGTAPAPESEEGAGKKIKFFQFIFSRW